jgi:DNA-binding transcriptional LysR family regulator
LEVHYTLRQLQYFVAVSQAGTLNEAASRCHVSPPALSLAISELERNLGVKLLVRRRSKGTRLTPGGSLILKLAESLLAQARDLQENADAESGGCRGRQSSGRLPHYAGSPVRPDPAHLLQGRVPIPTTVSPETRQTGQLKRSSR